MQAAVLTTDPAGVLRLLCRSVAPPRPAPETTAAVSPADANDIHETLHGNPDAYARLVKRYQPLVSAQMLSFSRNRTVHEELVHDVFVAAYLSLARYRGRAPFAAWLRTIAVRVGYRYLKNRARRRTHQPLLALQWDKSLLVNPQAAPRQEAADFLEFLLEMLSPRDRLVITLRYLEEKTVAQTAALTGWSPSLVKVQTWRAKKRLRRLLQQYEKKYQNR